MAFLSECRTSQICLRQRSARRAAGRASGAPNEPQFRGDPM